MKLSIDGEVDTMWSELELMLSMDLVGSGTESTSVMLLKLMLWCELKMMLEEVKKKVVRNDK